MDDFKRKFLHGFLTGLTFAGAIHAMDDIGNLDEVEGNVMDSVTGSFGRWMKKNPEKVQGIAEDVIGMILEYKELTSDTN